MDARERDESLQLMIDLAESRGDYVDNKLADRFKELIGLDDEKIKIPLIMLLDDIIYYALAGGTIVHVLQRMWGSGGGTDEIAKQIREDHPAHYEGR